MISLLINACRFWAIPFPDLSSTIMYGKDGLNLWVYIRDVTGHIRSIYWEWYYRTCICFLLTIPNTYTLLYRY